MPGLDAASSLSIVYSLKKLTQLGLTSVSSLVRSHPWDADIWGGAGGCRWNFPWRRGVVCMVIRWTARHADADPARHALSAEVMVVHQFLGGEELRNRTERGRDDGTCFPLKSPMISVFFFFASTFMPSSTYASWFTCLISWLGYVETGETIH